MSAHKVYGPWGPGGAYVWVDAERLQEARASASPGVTVMIQRNIAYASPVDGHAVTTWAARRYDMESNGCMDAREGRDCAADARKHWKTGLEGLTLDELRAEGA